MKIIKIDSFKQPEYVHQIAQVYKDVFEGDPWYQVCKCPVCDQTYPSNSGLCKNCEADGKLINLIEYWPISKIIADLYKQMSKKNSLSFVAIHNETIVGFSWGHEVSVDKDLDTYLGAPGLHKYLDKETHFYLDEIGVITSYQGKGIGKELVNKIFTHQRAKKVILKTLKDSQMYKMIEKMGGKTVLHVPGTQVIMSL